MYNNGIGEISGNITGNVTGNIIIAQFATGVNIFLRLKIVLFSGGFLLQQKPIPRFKEY
jgi:hypothetical protein